MGGLKTRVAGLSKFIPHNTEISYLDYAVHLNVGDLLITAGTLNFFKGQELNIVNQLCVYEQSQCLDRIRPGQTILFHGGGNFGDLWARHHEFRTWVIEKFTDHKIVILPQSVHFSSQAKLDETLKIFDRHKDLTICVRDNHSFDTLKGLSNVAVHLSPDMAHHLWQSDLVSAQKDVIPNETLLLIRRDIEGTEQEALFEHYDRTKMIDWPEINGPLMEQIYVFIRKGLYRNHPLLRHIPKAKIWHLFSEHIIRKSVNYFANYENVTTDRLHGTILGLLMNKNVTLIDSGYGKLSRYADCWLKDSPNLTIRTFQG